jgi:Holliday junction resolvase RusA-like endonuclease
VELDALIKVRWDTLLSESVLKADAKIVERIPSIRMTRGTKE